MSQQHSLIKEGSLRYQYLRFRELTIYWCTVSNADKRKFGFKKSMDKL